MSDDKKIKINCTGELEVNWRELEDLQLTDSGKKLKATDDEKIDKLVASLVEFGLVNNLQIWIDPTDKIKYCFDAHHRRMAFERLEELGYVLPLIPATRCLAPDKTTAKRLLIIKESKSSWVIPDTVEEYLEEVGISLDVANEYLDLPDIDFDELIFGVDNETIISQNDDEKSASSPWERLNNAHEGVVFSFGEVQKKVDKKIYNLFCQKISVKNLEEWLAKNLRN